ncbi:kinase-like domain-containing protein [Suillus lakei]|nr:kinase-like domain-containing protein [Suillus lakei]
MTGPAPVEDDVLTDFTSQISEKLKLGARPCASGSSANVYQFTIETNKGTTEVAVKVFKIDYGRDMDKIEKAMHRELKLWLRLSKHTTIVPLLGIACVDSPLPALVSQWMPSGTLDMYLEKQGSISALAKVKLVKGVADGLKYLHSENVVHGDLYPANVLVDGLGHPRLTDFGLATVAGDGELQLSMTTAGRSFNPRWRAPEVIGIDPEDTPVRPNFKSDVYSFGGVMFFIVSGDIPWKEKTQQHHIIIELSKRATPARPNNILDDHWNLIRKCWSWDPLGRPEAAEVIRFIAGLPPALTEDLTGQIYGTINDYVASGAFASVFRCEWRRPSGIIKVAVKSFRHYRNDTSGQDLRRFRRETAIWAHLVHDNIVTLYGTTEGFGPTTALVSQWFPDGTLFRLISEQGAALTIRSKLKLLYDIASGLYYLHSVLIVHGDITSVNVLVDIKGGEYKACLTDFGESNVLGGFLKDHVVEESTVRPGAVRWTAPELLRPHDLPSDIKPTTQNDMYSFGRVMFHLLTLIIPWHNIDEDKVIQKILNGEDIPRPEISEVTSDVTDARWNQIEQCWSVDPSARPSATMAMDFLKRDLEALEPNDVIVGGVQESDQIASLDEEQTTTSVPPSRRVQRQSSSQSLVPLRKAAFTSPLTYHLFSTVSSLSLASPLNVLLFGETGVGKSAIINLIMGRDVAQTSLWAETCTLQHTSHEVRLKDRTFKLWEVSSIEPLRSSSNFLAKWLLKKPHKLFKDDGVYLLLYCIRGSRAQRALVKDYKIFTKEVRSTVGPGRVSVAAVVTALEDYPTNMDNWWAKNKDNLERLGMQFSAHVCITSLPDDPHASPAMRARRQRSKQAIRSLLYESYQVGRTRQF